MDKKVEIVGLIDSTTPPGSLLSGKYKKTFAYESFTKRFPKIFNEIIGNVLSDKDKLIADVGEKSVPELNKAIEHLKELKDAIEANETLEPLTDTEPDTETWNDFLSILPNNQRTFYHACWLYAECYMYRRISSIFKKTHHLRTYDYFGKQKQNGMEISKDIMTSIVKANKPSPSQSDFETFKQLMKLDLWGNRCDLSISSGKEVKPGNCFDDWSELDPNLLVNNIEQVWKVLNSSTRPIEPVIEFICDNSGFEFFSDLLLAEFLIDKGLAFKVRFNVKAIPWYISDVTAEDFHWCIQYFTNHPDSEELRAWGRKLSDLLESGSMELAPVEHFWTSPYEFYRMENVSPNLHKRLSQAHLLIFKGDLNYRKLLGDYNWDYTETFQTCLRGFCPTNLCALRTIKADLICGLTPEKISYLFKINKDWMVTGEYGLIQFAECSSVGK